MLVLRGYACWVVEGLGVKVAEQQIAEPDLGGVLVEGAESDAPATVATAAPSTSISLLTTCQP